jgi:hypothetical protein
MPTHDIYLAAQWEGKEHDFLAYQAAIIQFIYSFSWDITKRSWEILRNDLLGDAPGSGKGWCERPLHERSCVPHANEAASYQPNLVGKTTVLERAGTIGPCLTLLSPAEEYQGVALGKCHKLNARIDYTIRFFDNGSGICTFAAHLPRDPRPTFEHLHLALHLANNVSLGTQPKVMRHHLTNTFIQLVSDHPLTSVPTQDSLLPTDSLQSATYAHGYCSLHDLFRRFLISPPEWAPTKATELWNDLDVIKMDNVNQDFQTPFVFTVAEVERQSFIRFRRHPTIYHAKEIGSILCKLTLDNRDISRHYTNLADDYIKDVLPYNQETGTLMNLCLDRRLFFALSRRGAVAITPRFDNLPSYFVLPSLLNLCEIVRARWHTGSVVSARLDRAIAELAPSLAANDPSEMNPLGLMEEMAKWRMLAASFLRDPVPFLFDGGSICELAERCQKLLWLDRLRMEVTQKFELLDQLVRDSMNLERYRRYQSQGK